MSRTPNAIIAISIILGAALAVPACFSIVMWNELPEFIATLSDVDGNATSWMAKGPAVLTLCGAIFVLGLIAWAFAYTENDGNHLFPAVSAVDVFVAVLASGLGTEILRVQSTTAVYAPTTAGITISALCALATGILVFYLLVTKPPKRRA